MVSLSYLTPTALCVLAVTAFASTMARAGTSVRAGLGVGMRVGLSRKEAWDYVPAMLPVEANLGEHLVLDVRMELGSAYFAMRPGAALLACTVDARQCVHLGASIGFASAAFDTAARVTALLVGASLGYQNQLGPTRYAARVEGEVLVVQHGGTPSGWDGGIGVSLSVLRTF